MKNIYSFFCTVILLFTIENPIIAMENQCIPAQSNNNQEENRPFLVKLKKIISDLLPSSEQQDELHTLFKSLPLGILFEVTNVFKQELTKELVSEEASTIRNIAADIYTTLCARSGI
jgi:hypothetical protein